MPNGFNLEENDEKSSCNDFDIDDDAKLLLRKSEKKVINLLILLYRRHGKQGLLSSTSFHFCIHFY